MNIPVERQDGALVIVVKRLWKSCIQRDWSKGLKVMSTFLQSKDAARGGALFCDSTDEFIFKLIADIVEALTSRTVLELTSKANLLRIAAHN